MGQEESKVKFFGSRSKDLFGDKHVVDFRDAKHIKKVKKELYDMFVNNELVHVDTVEAELKAYEKLQEEHHRLLEELHKRLPKDEPNELGSNNHKED